MLGAGVVCVDEVDKVSFAAFGLAVLTGTLLECGLAATYLIELAVLGFAAMAVTLCVSARRDIALGLSAI